MSAVDSIVAEHLKTAVLPRPGQEEIFLVEVGGPDFVPSVDDLEEISKLFMTALEEAGCDCPAVVVLNRELDTKVRSLKILQKVIDTITDLTES